MSGQSQRSLVLRRSISALVAVALSMSAVAVTSLPANSNPVWVDFDASQNAPYVGLENQGSSPIYAGDISTMHSVGGKYWFFRGPDLFSFDPMLQSAPTLVATTPTRSAGNDVTGIKNTTFVHNNLILYTGITSGIWAFDTTNNTSYEIKAGADSLRHIKDFTIFAGTAIFIAQIQGSTAGNGWGIYSVDLSTRSGSPLTYAATLRKATSFSVNAYSGFSGFAVNGNLVFYADNYNSDGASVWVMDNAWDSEALVDLAVGVNTQAGHMVASNGRLGFKARSSNTQSGQGEYFIMNISGVTPTTVDGTPAPINQTSNLLTRLTQLDGNPLDVSQAAGIGGRYIVIATQNSTRAAYSYDTTTGNYIRLASAQVNGAPIRPYKVGGVEMALISQGSQIRTYNPANGDFAVQVADVSTLAANGQSVYEFSLADTNADGNSDIAAFGVSSFNQPQRWFHAPVSTFIANAANKTVTFNSNSGTGSMADQIASATANLTTNSFTRTNFAFTGWNTLANGTGTAYANGASYSFAADLNLFAQWAPAFTVTFDANQGTGSMTAQVAGSATALSTNTFTRAGFVFTGWNTAANGSGTAYAEGASYPFAASTTLYAQWSAQPVGAGVYEGPVLSQFSTRSVDTCKPTTITITGTNLSGVSAKLSGVAVKVLENTATKLVMQVPAGLTPANKVDLVVTSSTGVLTVQDALDIKAGFCSQNISEGLWTKKQSASSIKFYAKSPIGEGKIQFFANGREIAWVNAVDETDPKLTFASGYPYLVRTFELAPGKNRVEIRLDGVRIWRATYAKR